MKTLRSDGRRGAVLVEFVIVLPFFLLLLLGAIDWGWYFVLRNSAFSAVRAGARVGSVQDDPDAAQAAARFAVGDYLARAGLRAHAPTVGLATVVVAGAPVTVIQVGLVNYPAGPITGFAPSQVPPTLTATATMRLEIQP